MSTWLTPDLWSLGSWTEAKQRIASAFDVFYTRRRERTKSAKDESRCVVVHFLVRSLSARESKPDEQQQQFCFLDVGRRADDCACTVSCVSRPTISATNTLTRQFDPHGERLYSLYQKGIKKNKQVEFGPWLVIIHRFEHFYTFYSPISFPLHILSSTHSLNAGF